MDITETLYVASREEWRAWLAEHHPGKREIWLECYKKGTGQPSIPYDDSVEEAICFGWVDGMPKSIDERAYALRFTPRRKKSNWSESNVSRVAKMLEQRRMTGAGLAMIPEEVLRKAQAQRSGPATRTTAKVAR